MSEMPAIYTPYRKDATMLRRFSPSKDDRDLTVSCREIF